MAVFAHRRNRARRRAVTGLLAPLAGLLASLAVLLAAPQAAAAVSTPGSAGAAVTSPGAPTSAGVTAVAFSPDGTLPGGGYGDGTVRLWVVATRQLRGPGLRSGASVTGVAF